VVRYTALALGDDWEVRASTEKGAFQRPGARVALVPSVQLMTTRWNLSKFVASFAIIAYPLKFPEADASQLEALRVTDLLWMAYAGPGVGNPVIRPAMDSHRGRPYRVPLYDYDGVPLDGDDAFADESRRDPRDFLHIEGQPEVTTVNDPGDELLYSVAANIRMSWLRSAAVTSTAPIVERVDTGAEIG
jgi:hypothetical protein